MDRSAFFASVRARTSGVFSSLSQSQVDGLNAILDEAEKRGTLLNHLAYILATVSHETGEKMQPVEEILAYTAKRLTQVWPKRFPTLASAQPYSHNPKALAEKVYGGRKDLGNTQPGDAWRFRGRGLPQITGRANYAKFGIEAAPESALQMPTALRITFDGMTKGLFTGKKLSDFITPTVADYYSARDVVNGDKKANGAKIAVTAKAFETALRAAGYDPTAPKPISDLPAPSFDLNPKPSTSTKETTAFWPALIRYVLTLWKGRKS